MSLTPQALEHIDGYDVLSPLKEGGMGAVYLVRHRLLREIRVAKIVRPQLNEDSHLQIRFEQEARTAMRLRHPNIVQIFDYKVDDSGRGIILMEYIEGVDLRRLTQDGLPSLPLVIEIARQSLRGLAHLHKRGFVHRDICPNNLMLALDVDRDPRVKIIDLGVAQVPESHQRLTSSGVFLGKYQYCSPEHFSPQEPGGIEARSDLYSLGIVLYELLTGSFPILGSSAPSLVAGHLHESPLAFGKTDPEQRVPEELRALILTALAKKPAERFASAEEFSDALKDSQAAHPLTKETITETLFFVEESRLDRDSDRLSTTDITPAVGQYFHSSVAHNSASGEALPVLVESENILLDEIFDTLVAYPVAMVLAQDGTDQDPLLKAMMKRAGRVFRDARILHIIPPFSSSVGIEEYFEKIGNQSGFRELCNSSLDWQDGLERFLASGNRLFILVGRFENGPEAGRRELSGVLRSLSETHAGSIRVVLSGGERLAAMKYESGAMSLLNHAEVLLWPEATSADILAWAKARFPTADLEAAEAEFFLRLGGAHPRLTQFCLQHRQRARSKGDEIKTALRNYGFLWQVFTQFRGDPVACERICRWLDREEALGAYRPWPADNLLRQLYWRNLLVERNGRYAWRCELLREVGKDALSCS